MITRKYLWYLLLIFVLVFAKGQSSESSQKKHDTGAVYVRLSSGICEPHKHPSNHPLGYFLYNGNTQIKAGTSSSKTHTHTHTENLCRFQSKPAISVLAVNCLLGQYQRT